LTWATVLLAGIKLLAVDNAKQKEKIYICLDFDAGGFTAVFLDY
jgi:single-stranded DNA-specific DHH superfamily exonuclease